MVIAQIIPTGHTRGSADDGFSNTAYATCPHFIEDVRRCEAATTVVGVARGGAQGGGAAASSDREIQKPNAYGWQARERERERERERA
jgi:hypothetical protein